MDKKIEEAYRAEVRRLIYPSLKTYINNENLSRINDLLEKLNTNGNDDDFPVISALYSKPLQSKGSIGNITFNLINEELVKEMTIKSGYTDDLLKKYILQEINLIDKINENVSNEENIQYNVRNFWDTVRYEFEEINTKNLQDEELRIDLQFIFKIINSQTLNAESSLKGADEMISKYYLFKDEFSRNKSMQRYFLIKILEEFKFYQNMDENEYKDMNSKIILDVFYRNGLSKDILDFYQIHHCELNARIHLKLIEANIIIEDYEFENEKQQNDARVKLREENLKQALNNINTLARNKIIVYKTSENTSRADNIEKCYDTRPEAVQALKAFIEQTGLKEYNNYLVDLWLIKYANINNSDKVKELRTKFLETGSIEINRETFTYKKFEKNADFLESNIAKNVRKEKDAEKLMKDLVGNRQRSDILNTFLEKNKLHFLSHGSNIYFYEKEAIEKTAANLYRKLKLYKNLESVPAHKIIIDSFKSFKVLLHIRYNGKNRLYDGIGHFGGFAQERKGLQIKDESGNFQYKKPQDLVASLNSVLTQDSFPIELKYDGDRNVHNFQNKQELISFLSDFNDLLVKANRIFYVSNEETVKRQAAIIAANKKFNNLCTKDELHFLKTIYEKYKENLAEEHSLENNGAIKKAGMSGPFNAEKFKYDKSTVFSLGVSSSDFEDLIAKTENKNTELKEVTTSLALSLFELIQRFGYFGETGSPVTLISEQDDYKSYAYKYPHEYFAGPIRTITKILDEVEKKYKEEFNKTDDECKNLRLWILGHLFAAAQNDILDGKNYKLTKQNIEITDNIRRFTETKKPAKHVLNLKKYIHENYGQVKTGQFDDEQLEFMQKFFGRSMTANDFDKIQEIASSVHVSVTLKNIAKPFLDCGRLCMAQFNKFTRDAPLFKDSKLTVYENLEYENEFMDSRRVSFDGLETFGYIHSVKQILLRVLSKNIFKFPDE